MTAAEHHGDFECASFDVGMHRPGTKSAGGRCSWTEDCPAPPSWSTRVTRSTSRDLYALCDEHHARVHQHYTDTSTTPEGEVEHLLETWADGFARRCRAEGDHARDATRDGTLSLGRRGLQRDECVAFLRTWRAGYVEVRIDGSFTLPGLGTCPPELNLLSRNEDGTSLNTEYLIQIGVIAELIEDHGWAPGELAFEQGEFDALGHRDGRVQLAVEAKARADATDPDGLARLEASFRRSAEDPAHQAPPNHARKWTALRAFLEHGPLDVLLVASGARRWLRAQAGPDGTVELDWRDR